MQHVYTDQKFPGIEIVSHGKGLFEVREGGVVVSTFESWERPDGTVTEVFAARRARDYFTRLSAMDSVPEYPEERPAVLTEGAAKASEIDSLLAKERIEGSPEKKRMIREQIIRRLGSEQTVAEAVVSCLLEV